ncbi:MAG: Ig-like domain-containing protein, partial [Flavobacteriales bacterium]
ISEDQVGQISLAPTDTEGEVITYSVFVNSGLGNSVISSQTLTFTPTANINGLTSVILNVCDAANACIQDTVFINIIAVNDAPTVNSDAFTTNEDVILSGNVSFNDSDVETGALLYSIITAPGSGTLNFNSNGSFTYTPPLNFSGLRTFTYNCCDAQGLCNATSVNISITAVNDAPVINAGVITLNEGGSSIFLAAISDVDNPNSQLSLSLLQSVPGISFTFVANNIVVIPQGNYFGSAIANIQVCDGTLCGSAEFTIIVNPVPDPPSAANSVITIFEDQTESAQIPAPNDPDSDEFIYYGISASGEIIVTASGLVTYTCPLNYNGEDTITYAVCDETGLCDTAQVYVVVLPVNDVPFIEDVAAVLNEDEPLNITLTATDIENNNLTWSVIQNPLYGALSLNNNEVTYIPNANYYGLDSAVLRVCDAPGSCNIFQLGLTINAVNDAPQIFGESFSIYAGNQTFLPLSGNDLDVDDAILVYTILSGADLINASIEENSDLTFNPTLDNLGVHIVNYQACDGGGLCDTATAVITILDPSPYPSALDDTLSIFEDNAITFNAFANDQANDLYSQYSIVAQGNHGVAVITLSGTVSYTPLADFFGSDSILIELCNTFHCDSSLVIISINPVNDSPFSMPANITVTENILLEGDASIYASDAEGDGLTFIQQNEIELGDFNLSADGQYTFTGNQPGVDTLFYTICDAEYCINSYFVVIVNSVINNSPSAQNVSIIGYSNNAINISLNNLFVDENVEALSFSFMLSQDPHGE